MKESQMLGLFAELLFHFLHPFIDRFRKQVRIFPEIFGVIWLAIVDNDFLSAVIDFIPCLWPFHMTRIDVVSAFNVDG